MILQETPMVALKDLLMQVLKNVQDKREYAEILQINKGIPVAILIKEAGNPTLAEVKQAVISLLKKGKITLNGIDDLQILAYLDNGDFLSSIIASKEMFPPEGSA